MSEIPEDIMKTAIDWLTKPVADQYGNHLSYFTGSRYSDHASRIISFAIMAERERAAKIAENYSHSFSVALCHYGSADKDAGRGRQEGHIKAGADIAAAIRTPPKPSSEPTP